MQAVILAGGLGTRLKPLTEQIPKVMVQVNGKPFLLYLLELIRSQGISDIVLCIGHLGKQVRDYFNDGESLGVRIRYSDEKERLLGTGGAVKEAQPLLDDYFLVLNGDTYLPIDYREVERAFLRRGKKALMLVYYSQLDAIIRSNTAIDNSLMVIRHDKESHDLTLNYVDAGLLALKREALDLIKEDCSISLERGLYPALIQQRELAAYVIEQRFYSVGTWDEMKIFEEYLIQGAK